MQQLGPWANWLSAQPADLTLYYDLYNMAPGPGLWQYALCQRIVHSKANETQNGKLHFYWERVWIGEFYDVLHFTKNPWAPLI